MSLINNLLKDLDKRKTEGATDQTKRLDEYIQIQAEQTRSPLKRLSIILTLGMVIIAGVSLWKFGIPVPRPSATAKTQPIPTTIKPNEPVHASQITIQNTDSQQKTANSLQRIYASHAPETAQLLFYFEKPVEYELLEQNEKSWLITFKNAALDTTQDLNQIKNKWIESIALTKQENNLIAQIKLNQDMIAQGKITDPENPGKMQFQFVQAPMTIPTETIKTLTNYTPQLLNELPDKLQVPANDIAQLPKEAEATQAQSEPTEQKFSFEDERFLAHTNTENTETAIKQLHQRDKTPKLFIKKPLTKEQQATKTFDESMALLSRGELSLATTRLKNTLQIDPHHTLARETLIKVLIKLGHLKEASNIVDQGLINHQRHLGFLKLKARILNTTHGANTALEFLKKNSPNFSSDLEYQAFMAALYHQTGQSKSAAEIYKKLLTADPAQGRWQFGFGMALDSMGEYADAKLAYQRALDYNQDLNSESIHFIEGRIRQLRRL